MKKEKTYFGFGGNVFFTGLVSFFMDVSSEMIYPLVPLFLVGVLGVNMSMIGLIEGIAESTASLLKVFSGWWGHSSLDGSLSQSAIHSIIGCFS